jgi:hypothetical protein
MMRVRRAFFIPFLVLASTLCHGEQAEEPKYDYEKQAKHWSFLPVLRQDAGSLKDPSWAKHPLDTFVLAKLEECGLAPNPPASEHTLKRRASYALAGLPPDWEACEDTGYEAYIDQLLASPSFGERWARLWLDVARYAEDQAHIVGNNASLTYPNAWKFREWVINALNDDLPYDEFLKLQLAADLVSPECEDKQIALGFMGLGPKYYRRGDLAVMADEWEDRVDTLSRGVLGLTVACSRCHDHFSDPIPTSDYYAIAGVFASTDMFNKPMGEGAEKDKDGSSKKPDNSLHLVREAKSMKDLPVYIRGDVKNPGSTVKRGFLSILGGGQRQEFSGKDSGRLELAEAVANRNNPLTARVWVNRVWAEMMGKPLVATTSNFGVLGEKPSHPELLDDLSARFMEEGNWSLKWLAKEIALSSTFRQSSEANPAKMAKDPGNHLLWRMERRRLSAEMLRDSLYSAAGNLDTSAIGGKSFDAHDPEANRRAIYARSSRLELDPFLALFDFPDPNLHSPGRKETTTPLQKLFLLNSQIVTRQAEAFVKRLDGEKGGDCQVEEAYRILFGRKPDTKETQVGQYYLAKGKLSDYTQALLCTNEFSWVD